MHLLREHLFEARPDLLVGKKLPTVELAQTGRDLFSQPCIVIEIVFDKLLDILVRVAAVLRCHPIELCLQFPGEVYFHTLNLLKTAS